MSGMPAESVGPIRLRLPATSANLGAGFDAAAVALGFYLEMEADAGGGVFDSGHGARCGALLGA